MVQAQKANDTGIAAAKHTNRPAKQHSQRLGFWGALGMSIVTLVWLLIGEITNNKRRFIL